MFILTQSFNNFVWFIPVTTMASCLFVCSILVLCKLKTSVKHMNIATTFANLIFGLTGLCSNLVVLAISKSSVTVSICLYFMYFDLFICVFHSLKGNVSTLLSNFICSTLSDVKFDINGRSPSVY